MGKNRDFERGMIVGARGDGLSISKLLTSWDFLTQLSPKFTGNATKKNTSRDQRFITLNKKDEKADEEQERAKSPRGILGLDSHSAAAKRQSTQPVSGLMYRRPGLHPAMQGPHGMLSHPAVYPARSPGLFNTNPHATQRLPHAMLGPTHHPPQVNGQPQTQVPLYGRPDERMGQFHNWMMQQQGIKPQEDPYSIRGMPGQEHAYQKSVSGTEMGKEVEQKMPTSFADQK